MPRPTVIRYAPPKSSLWGHGMGNRSPAAFRDAVAAFLARAASSHATEGCWLSCSITSASEVECRFVRDLAEATELPAGFERESGLTRLSETALDRCLDWLISHQDRVPARAERSTGFHFSLGRNIEISGWNHDRARDSETAPSTLDEDYGTMQHLGMHLVFASLDEYRWVRQIAESTLGIRMHDRNLPPRGIVSARPARAPRPVPPPVPGGKLLPFRRK